MDDNEIWYLWSPWLETTNSPWEEVLNLGKKRRFKKNSIILGQGQTSNELYYLHSGMVKLSSVGANGTEKAIWYITAGNVFGEVPFFDRIDMHSIFTCIEDSIVYSFSREVITKTIFPQYPQIVMNVFEIMSKKLRLMSSQINDLGLNSPKLRVYKMIYSLLFSNQALHVSQQELAELLGIHRVTLNRIISDLKGYGIIRDDVNTKNLYLHDPQGLLALIEAEQ